MRIVIPGGTGQVGTILARYFRGRGETVTLVNRASWHELPAALEGADVCINLAGRSVNCRYGRTNRCGIYDSRIGTTRQLNELIASAARPPRVWLNASTATIYRHTQAPDPPNTEAQGCLGGDESGAPAAWNFSIRVARAWEDAFFAKRTPRTRKIAMRSAITFSPDRGGAFDILLKLARRGLGGTQGSGKQFVSWIHEVDFARAVAFLIEREDLEGVVNIAAPNPLPNCDFLRVLREACRTRIALPAPSWLIEIGAAILRTESELVLKSRYVIPGRLLEAGFRFRYPQWPAAARDLVAECTNRH